MPSMTSVPSATEASIPMGETSVHSEASAPCLVLEPFDTAENAETPPEILYPDGFKFAMICLAVALAVTLTGLDLNIVATAVPSITDDFHTIADVGWYSAAYRLTTCAFQFMFGKMYAVFSIKWVYISTLFVFEAGNLLCATASSSAMFILGRAVCGMGAAGIIAGCFTMITLSLPLRRRPIFSGATAMVEETASVCSPILGGLITEKTSWRWCFYMNLPLGLTVMAIIIIFFQNPDVPYAEANDPTKLSFLEKLGKLDLLGTLIFVPSITCMLLGLQFGGSNYGWTDSRVIVCFIVFAILLVIFGYWQWRRGDEAILPPRIIGHRSIMSGMWFSVCNSSAYSIIQYYMPIYFQAIRGVSASRSGVLILPLIIGLMISLPLAGSATSLVGHYAPFMLLASLLTPIATGLLTTLKVTMPIIKIILYLALLGFGAGIGWQGPQVAAQSVCKDSDIVLGIASILFAQNFGPAFSVPIAQTIFQDRLVNDVQKHAPESGFNAANLQRIGLSDLRRLLGGKDLAGILIGYDQAIAQTFYLSVGLACATLLGSAAMEWRSVKRKIN